MSNRRFKKGTFFPENPVLFSYLAIFAHFFLKTAFLLLDHFFESLITHKRFVFKESYISYGKRQKELYLL